jgi:PKD repeat protein
MSPLLGTTRWRTITPPNVLIGLAMLAALGGCVSSQSTPAVPSGTGGTLKASISSSVTSGRAPLDVVFNSVVSGGNGIYRYNWTFGDGRTSSEANPRVQFVNGGTYDVRLEVSSNDQTFTTDPLTLRLDGDLMVTCSADPIESLAPVSVSFRAAVRGGNGALTYNWDFGDGTSSTAASPDHTYANAGTYRQVLTVSSGAAGGICTNTVTVYGVFRLNSCKATPTGGTTVQFHATPSFCLFDDCAYSWDFGGGGGGSGLLTARPLFTYSGPGTYTAHLDASTNGGKQSASCNVTVTVP